MTPPTFLVACYRVLAKDLTIERRTFETLLTTGLTALIAVLVFSFAFDLATVRKLGPERLVPGVLWVSLAFASLVGLRRSFEIERRQLALRALMLAPVDRGAIYIGKTLANWLQLILLTTILVPLTAILFDLPLGKGLWLLLLLTALHALGLAELGTLFAGVVTRLGRGESLLGVLLLPAATPLLLSAITTGRGILAGGGGPTMKTWLLVTTGCNLLYLLVGWITFEFVLEE